MKKQLLCTLTMLAFLGTSAAQAHDPQENPPNERMSTIMSFGIMTVVSAAIYKGGDAVNLNGATQGLLHAANVLYNAGQIADKPVFKDLASRVLIAGTAAATATHPRIAGVIGKDAATGKPLMDPNSQLVAFVPLIGKSLQQAGVQGVGVVTVALYSLYGYAYEALRDLTPVGKFLGLT